MTNRKLSGCDVEDMVARMKVHAKPIPISAGEQIAKKYGYDQVVIIARKVDTELVKGGEHVTTYGIDKAHCDVAARMGYFFKHKLMGWPEP